MVRARWAVVVLASLGVGCGSSADGDTEPLPDGMVMVDGTVMMMMPDGNMVPADVPSPRDAGMMMLPDGNMVPVDTGVMPGMDAGVPPDMDAGPPPPPPANAVLEVHAMDLWAQPLPLEGRSVTLRRDGMVVVPTVSGSNWVYTLPLRDAAQYELSVASPDHRTLTTTVVYDGSALANGVTLRTGSGTVGQGLSLAHATTSLAGREVAVHRVFVGLRHNWFSAQGRPARRGNRVTLLMDGEEAWTAVHRDLLTARNTVHMATWWWESNFELVRGTAQQHIASTLDQRRRNTILSVLESLPARKRVMVGQFLNMDGTASSLSSDDALRAHGTQAGDNFEHMGQANPTRGMFRFEVPAVNFGERVRAEGMAATGDSFDRETAIPSDVAARDIDLTQWPAMVDVLHASYHQKFAVIDSRVAFIGGMNLRRVDWDTSAHEVFEPRRMLLDATTANRQAVAAHTRMPDTGPRKDYMARIEGPAVRDAEDIFRRRWNYLLDTNARYSPDASRYDLGPVAAPIAGGVQAQVTATLPAPFHEYAIAETWLNAIRQAREYILIEDQYFRIPMLTDELARRMEAMPSLRVVVITKPISEWTDPGCAWTRRTHEQMLARFGSRYTLLQLQAFDTEVTWGIDETESRFQTMDVHSKLLIVDDVFLSVGSCNKNNRGVVYEGELNLAVHDRAWVTAARRRVIANMLPAGTVLAESVTGWFTQMIQAAQYNDRIRANWEAEGDDISLDGRPLPEMYRPRGFLYTLPMRSVSRCLIESIGPDMV